MLRWTLLCALLVGACADSSPAANTPDAALADKPDAVSDATANDAVARDASSDASTDEGRDASADEGTDASPDASPDVSADVATDAAPLCRSDDDCRGHELGFTRCDVARGVCVACTADTQCPAGTICEANVCAPGCAPGRGCGAGEACCGGSCVRTDGDPANCGACARVCALANGTARCAMGACAVASCAPGYGDCDGDAADGCETDVTSSLAHCGACGATCAAPANAAARCAMGRCGFTCNAGFADCDGDATNGCEAATQTSATHCGACGNVCPAPANASAACAAGRCGFACNADFADCDGDATNGCEAPTQTSATHCGACGRACPTPANSTASCAAGRCASSCNEGFADCDGDATNGCEANLTGTANCGRCGNACSGGTPLCNRGPTGAACSSGCDTGEIRCGGTCVNATTDVNHCNACGAACPGAVNARAVCAAGRCGLSCADGFGDCDGEATNGCESDTRVNVSHCGACGRACPMGPQTVGRTCTAGRCGAVCAAGFADCNGDPSDGCEVDLRTSDAHCGACGNACGTGRCASGACLPCGACGGGADGAFAPTGSVMLASGTFRFTSVTIPAGVTVRVQGSAPLRIFSAGPVRVLGTLDLSGANGGLGVCGNGPVSNEGLGGPGGAAGARGGFYAGTYTLSPSGGGRGGGAGAMSNLTGPGGGGAGYATAGVAGATATCCPARCGTEFRAPGGAAGATYGGVELASLEGGSGGGAGGFGGADNGCGGGGGGGGGAGLIVAPTIEVSGAILANGGNGGNEDMACDGGGGGGGSGGALWLRASTVTITGGVSAVGGVGGTTSIGGTCGLGGAGGVGGLGRVRVDATTLTGTSTPAPFRGAFACSGAPCE
jgi:hypothetical protein